jgi:WD40 repeat protein
MKTAFLSLTALLLLAVSRTLPEQTPSSPSYAKDVRPFLAKYCYECHNQKTLKGKLNLETFAGLMKGSSSGEVVVPGKADDSPLVLLVEGKDMPKMPPKEARQPKAKELAVLRAWVTAGAKDDSADFKVTLPEVKPTKTAQPPVAALAYRADGKALAVAGHHKVLILDPATSAGIQALGPVEGKVTALAYQPSGNHLAVAHGLPGGPGTVGYYSAGGHFRDFVGHADTILDIAFSAEGKTLASCSYDRTVKLWDVATGKALQTLKEHSDAVYAVAFHKDGALLASGGADRAIKIWRVATGKLLYTLGESTDWLYAIAWSPDGKHLTAGGVDKSIRVWEVNEAGGKLVQSVFAHEAPILRLIYSADGKTLYSLAEDRSVKAWDVASMTERKVYARQPESMLSMALRPDQKQIALGRFDGALVLLDEKSGAVQAELKLAQVQILPPEVEEQEPNDSPGTGQFVKLPVTIAGSLQRTGDVDWFRFEVQAGQQLGVQLTKEAGSKVEPFLTLTDAGGKVLATGEDGLLGYTFASAGTYAIAMRDRDYRGGDKDWKYRLRLGEIPIVTSLFPLGVQRGQTATIAVDGVFLGDTRTVAVKATDAAPGTKLPITLSTKFGPPLGKLTVVVDEYPDVIAGKTNVLPVPGVANGKVAEPGATDSWRFTAKKGQHLIVEVNARRLGSPLDSFIEILDSKGNVVPRATLRSLAKTFVTFRDHDSAGPGIRIDAWNELAVNDFVLVGTELLKIKELPPNPDADCIFFSERGQRLGWLDTTPSHHAQGTPMYKVAIHPPGTQFPANGFPVVTLYYRNDDGGPGYGRDSRLTFDPPADGEFQVRIGDSRGQGNPLQAYRLTVRPPRPSFNVSFNPTAPAVWKGSGIAVTATAERIDGFDGPIEVQLDHLPPGFSAPPTTIPAGENSTAFALYATDEATQSAKGTPLVLTARATIDGREVVKQVTGGMPTLRKDVNDITTTTAESEITLKPGGEVRLKVKVDRHNAFAGRIPLEVRGLPHGVRVLDIGLNGILITEKETERVVVIYAEPWVQAMDHPIVVLARREGKNTEHAAQSVLLRIAR